MKCRLLSRPEHPVLRSLQMACTAATALLVSVQLEAASVTLAWDPSTDPNVTGYNLYYGGGSRNYTNVLDANSANAISVGNLAPGVTYFFAATAYTAAGLESEYSVEVSYAVPSGTNTSNVAPTVAQPADLVVNENCGPQTINLTGISSGSPTEQQTLTVSAFSGNPALIAQPSVNYVSPNSTASLMFVPAANAYGTCTITVSVYDGGAVSNTTIRAFQVSVLPVNNAPTLDPLADVAVDENSEACTVNLSGITAGTGDTEAVTISATSSNPDVIPAPAVSYSSPGTTGLLTFTPAANRYGTSRITVTVDDGQATNRLATRSFLATVRQSSGGGTNAISSTAFTLLWQNTSSGAVATWEMDGTNLTSSKFLNVASVPLAWKVAGHADFDGDGQLDILWQHTDSSVALWLMQETNCTATMRLGSSPMGQGWRVASTTDLNADGHPDILWQHSSGATAVWFMEGTNCTGRARLNAPLAGSGWTLAGAGHFNLDGHTDLLWQNTAGNLVVWRMDGTNCTSNFRLSTPQTGSSWHVVALADLTGSGQSDLIWEHDNGALAYWLMDGTNRVGAGRLKPASVPPAWRVAGPR